MTTTSTTPPRRLATTQVSQVSQVTRIARVTAVGVVAALLLTACGTTRADPPAGSPADGTAQDPAAGAASPATAPAAAPAGVTEVPDTFPLAAGLPTVNQDDGSPVAVTDRPTWTDVELCGATVWSRRVPVAATDVAGASYTGESEDLRSRVLAVYADAPAARQSFDALRDAYSACPEETVGGTDQVYEVVDTHQGSATVTHRYRGADGFDPGLEVIGLVVVGNALSLSSYYAEGGSSRASVADMLAFADRSDRPVRTAMTAVFGNDDGTSTPPATSDLGDFPLDAGWPADEDAETEEGGLTLPIDRFTADFADYTCGRAAPAPRPDQRLRGQFSNVEDYRTRELVVLADADAAVAWVGRLRAFYEACPVKREDDLTYPVTVLESAVGGQSFGVLRATEYLGEPTLGLSALHVVRVGRSVLLDSASGEGMVRDPQVDGPRVLDALSADTTAVVTAMCAFTEAGC